MGMIMKLFLHFIAVFEIYFVYLHAKYQANMRKLILLTFCIIFSAVSHADRLDSLYHAIDDVIKHADDYMLNKQQQLAELRQRVVQAKDDKIKYDATMALYEAYASFRNDSAVACLNRCINIADEMGRQDLKNISYIRMGKQQSTAGFYNEAMDYMSRIQKQELSGDQLTEYHYTMRHLYGEMGAYTQDMVLRQEYYRLSARHRDSLLAIIPHDTEIYLGCMETKYSNDHNYEAALDINDKRMRLVTPGTHEYAIVSYFRSVEYAGLGNRAEEKYWLAQSALSDIKNCVMDQASLWSLADILSEEGDIDRSHRYVEYSWACTSHFSAHVRSWLVSPVLTMINDKYKENIKKKNTNLLVLMIITSLLAIFMAGLYIYVSRKREQLAIARNELKETNDRLTEQSKQLSDANAHLSSLNKQLTSLNEQLSLSNRVKEDYIGKFFTLCSEYIDKLDKFRIKVNRKMKAHQYDDLMVMSNNEKMREDELAVLYANFDNIFLHIFPNFLDDFNALLKPEHVVGKPDNTKQLPTDVRIFALIRLGIEDSSKISEFLHYSPNTIYNYRSRMKNRAIDPNNFEEQIKKIESKG